MKGTPNFKLSEKDEGFIDGFFAGYDSAEKSTILRAIFEFENVKEFIAEGRQLEVFKREMNRVRTKKK